MWLYLKPGFYFVVTIASTVPNMFVSCLSVSNIMLGSHDAICLIDSIVSKLGHCLNFKAMI